MFLKITWATEEFSTRITFVIFLSFMKCLHMLVKISWSGEGFSTRIAFVISLSFAVCLDVCLQISWLSEEFSTRITFVIFCPSWSVLMCLLRDSDEVKTFSQESHLRFLEPFWCKFLIWLFSTFFVTNILLHILHVKIFASPCVDLICCFIIFLVWNIFSLSRLKLFLPLIFQDEADSKCRTSILSLRNQILPKYIK